MGLVLWITPPDADAAVPVLTVMGGEIVPEELGQFSASSVALAAGVADDAGVSAAERAILAMAPYTLCEVVEEGVGTLTYGYVLNPSQQITDRGEDTITLQLEPLTTECMWRRLGRDFEAQVPLSVLAGRIAATAPGWAGTFDGQATAADITVLFGSNNETVLGGFLSAMRQFAQYARLGTDATGAPARVLQGGQFGADSGVTIQDAKGGDPDAMATNGAIRLVRTLDRSPNNVEELCTVTVPFGGGQDDDSLVTLERLWRIVNDPSYPGYGRYGPDADSIARTGQPSLFPEYDDVNYPISDPENPPTGVTLYDGAGNLLQGAVGTRRATLKGRWDYAVFDRAAYALYGHKETTDYIDSTLTYTSNNPADQELTQRALYLSIVGYFKRYAHPHHTITVTTNTAHARPPRAGDIVHLDYQKQSRAVDGTLVEVSEVGDYRVMKVVRSFPTDGSGAYDTYTLSNLGRFDADDASGGIDTSRTVVALQRQQGTGLQAVTYSFTDNVDALHPITMPFPIPDNHFRWHRVWLRCAFQPYRATSTTGLSSPTPVRVATPHGDHTLQGAGVTDTGIAGTTDGFDLVQTGVDNDAVVQMVISNDGTNVPDGQNLKAELVVEGGNPRWRLFSSGVPNGRSVGSSMKINFTKAKTKSPFTAAVDKAVAAADTLTGTADPHTHPLDQRIPDGPLPAAVTLAIDGVALPSGAPAQGARDASGAFTQTFTVTDLSAYLGRYVGGDVPELTFTAGTSPANPYGVGKLHITILAVDEWGGLASTVRIAD